MKRILREFGVIMLCCFFGLSISFAAEEGKKVTGTKTEQASPDKETEWTESASGVIGKKLVTPEGEDLGEITDFVVGADGRIRYVILSSGGFLGIGEEEYTIEWNEIKPGEKTDSLIADVKKSQLEEFTKREKEAKTKGKTGPKTTESAEETKQKPAETPDESMESYANDWINKRVVGKDGKELGRVENLFINSEGRVLYVVVSRLHPVPINVVKKEGDELKVDYSEEKFRNSVSFSEAKASDIGQPEWEEKIRAYYGKEKVKQKEQKQ